MKIIYSKSFQINKIGMGGAHAFKVKSRSIKYKVALDFILNLWRLRAANIVLS